MLRLPLLNLASRETNRLPAAKINQMLGCGGAYGGGLLPLELQHLPQFPSGEFVVYYGNGYYGELPPNHNRHAGGEETFLLVRVDGCKEHILEEGEVEQGLKIKGINTPGIKPYSHFIGTGKVLGRLSFYCVSPDFSGTPATPPVRQGIVGSGFKELIAQLAGRR